MILTCERDFIYAYQRKSARAMANDALRSPRVLSVHRRLQRTFSHIVLGGTILFSASIALSEDGVTRPEKLSPTYPQLRGATSYKIAMSPHGGTENLIGTSKPLSAASAKRRSQVSWSSSVGFMWQKRAPVTIKGSTSSLSNVLWPWKRSIPRVLKRSCCEGMCLAASTALRKPKPSPGNSSMSGRYPLTTALLGDALMEQGRLDDAIAAYQQMVDLRPGLQSYSRVAHIRWLKGDLEGAIEAARLAARAASPLDPESASWSLTRLGQYQFQAELLGEAKAACDSALRYSPDYPAALLLQSRMLLAAGQAAEALAPIQRATDRIRCRNFGGRSQTHFGQQAALTKPTNVEAALKRTGAQDDARTFSLFLATRGEQVELAVELGAARTSISRRCFYA